MDKDPKKVAAGRKGAHARWGEPRVVRLDGLTPTQVRMILAVIETLREMRGEESK